MNEKKSNGDSVNSKLVVIRDAATTFERATPRDGILTLSGYGIRVVVQSGHLVVEDGLGSARRRARFSRAAAGFKRLVVLGHSGVVTLEAARWLNDIGAAFVQIDTDGTLLATFSASGLDDARLRRAQALAAQNGVGLEIARDLIRRKLAGQIEVARRLRNARVVSTIEDAIGQLNTPRNADELRLLESHAAKDYWEAWQDIDVVFVQRDLDRLPEHWRTFGARASLITGNPRKASNPANAILNYLYSILEAEVRIAALRIGLDPGIGVMHADLKARDSLVCDLMEAFRPNIDEYTLTFLQKRAFKKADFFETRAGVCRLMPNITNDLVKAGSTWSGELGFITEHVARSLIQDVPTLLTQSNRRRGRTPANGR